MDPSPDPSTAISLQLLFLAFLILINAFFSAAEMAIVSVNKNKLKVLAQAENQKAMLLLKLLEQPNRFLSTIQVAITLAGFLASASAATSMADDIGMSRAKPVDGSNLVRVHVKVPFMDAASGKLSHL